MVYLDGDNDLENEAINNFLLMSEVGSTYDVNIIVQFDRNPSFNNDYDDWNSTKRYYINKGMIPDNSNALMDLGELNMGDPQTLIDFSNWAIQNYPARKYFLILWDHGSGWDGVCYDGTSNDDYLDINELGVSFKEITNNGVNKLEVIGFDACVMQMLEVSYELRNYGNFMLASEALQLGGWIYNSTFSSLTKNPRMSTINLGIEFINDFIVENICGYLNTLSLINLEHIDNLKNSVNNLAEKLVNEDYIEEIILTNEIVEEYQYLEYRFSIDLYDFASLLKNYIENTEIKNSAQIVMNEIERVVEYEKHGSDYLNSYGISIYLPIDEYNYDYSESSFAKDNFWNEFIIWYLNDGNFPPNKPNTPVGPTKGEIGKEYTYKTLTTDPEGDRIFYSWRWKELTYKSTDYYDSGDVCSISFRWDEEGTYEITVSAIDERGAQSLSSDPLSVTMPKSIVKNKLFQRIYENFLFLPFLLI